MPGPEGCQTSGRVAFGAVPGDTLGYSPGVCSESPCSGRPAGAILSGPSAPETYAGALEALTGDHRERVGPVPATASTPADARGPRQDPVPWSTLPIHRTPTTAGPIDEWTRSRSGVRPSASCRSPSPRPTSRRGCATPSSSTSTTTLPDRRPERLRQGLARDPLPLADQPDAGPDRRLQRPGRVRGRPRGDRGRGAGQPGTRRSAGPAVPAPSASRSASSRRGSAARAARPTSTRATPSPTSSSARPTGWPTPPACRSPSARATPTTRSSCTAASASARPT